MKELNREYSPEDWRHLQVSNTFKALIRKGIIFIATPERFREAEDRFCELLVAQEGHDPEPRSYLIVKLGQMPIYFARLSEKEIRRFVSEEFEVYQRVKEGR